MLKKGDEIKISEVVELVMDYHQKTKHHFYSFARGPGYLDWNTQPDPFRRYLGTTLIKLDKVQPTEQPLYEPAFLLGNIAPSPLNFHSISQLLFDSLAISAWKSFGDVSWALRVNPSSGNLHPTEGYIICGPVDELCDTPTVYHYAPKEHGLEFRAEFSLETWRSLTGDLPTNTIFLGLTSIHWRESWKYGERAFRYCQHDAGHAIAAVTLAAAGLGWQATLLDDIGREQLGKLLGVSDQEGPEAEHPDCLLAIYSQTENCLTSTLPTNLVASFDTLSWRGKPNQLSPDHVDWQIIDHVAEATTKPPTHQVYEKYTPNIETLTADSTPISFRKIIHQRRSAVALNGRTGITRNFFYKILRKTLVGRKQFPFNALPWRPYIHLALFVHRVQDLNPGLYMLVRDASQKEVLKSAMKNEFAWEKPEGCADNLELYLLKPGDMCALAGQLSCNQDIAADGCFSLGMIAEFERPLRQFGPWFYPRLFWECGMIGQVLYLEAESVGIRGTGIGCFFDNPVHDLLGVRTIKYQSLYHFTMGGYVEDTRLTTLPAYPPNLT